jgi:Kef-type K+ transport system membrane component KefB
MFLDFCQGVIELSDIFASPYYSAMIIGLLIIIASIISVELGLSVAIIEIFIGIIAGSFGVQTTPWMDYLATFGGVILTFLAGAEIDTALMRKKFKTSTLIGFASFFAPWLGVTLYSYYIAQWGWEASALAGVALSTTSLAVVYAVLVETGLTNTQLGKIIMAATFVTDLGTMIALTILFAKVNYLMIVFIAVMIIAAYFAPRMILRFFSRYGKRVIETEIKFIFAIILILSFVAEAADTHAVLAAFIIGLILSKTLSDNGQVTHKMRTVALAFLTPIFFIKAGLNVSLPAVYVNLGLVLILFAVKIGTKFIGVYPLSKKYLPDDALYTTLLMSTGLTFGTISAVYGLSAKIINIDQFSILVTVVVASAVIPTIIAKKFEPLHYLNGNNNKLK